jgi:hypothetical protein
VGDLFVASPGIRGKITEITPQGVQSIFASGVTPYGLAFNSAGDLFEADYDGSGANGSINEFTPGGAESTFASGLGDLNYLAFQPVPEPSVLSLLAVGATALLLYSRRTLTT